MLVEHGAQPGGAAAPARARQQLVDRPEVKQTLDLRLVAGTLEGATIDDGRETQERHGDRGAGDAVVNHSIRWLQALAEVGPHALDPPSAFGRDSDLDLGPGAAPDTQEGACRPVA